MLVAVRLFFELPSRETDLVYSPAAVIGLVLVGVVMGIASGLFGIGGGVILVPLLISFFGFGDLLAKGTSLLAMIPTSITGSNTAGSRRTGSLDLRGRAPLAVCDSCSGDGVVGVLAMLAATLTGVGTEPRRRSLVLTATRGG